MEVAHGYRRWYKGGVRGRQWTQALTQTDARTGVHIGRGRGAARERQRSPAWHRCHPPVPSHTRPRCHACYELPTPAPPVAPCYAQRFRKLVIERRQRARARVRAECKPGGPLATREGRWGTGHDHSPWHGVWQRPRRPPPTTCGTPTTTPRGGHRHGQWPPEVARLTTIWPSRSTTTRITVAWPSILPRSRST